jgi:hypothetical protein
LSNAAINALGGLGKRVEVLPWIYSWIYSCEARHARCEARTRQWTDLDHHAYGALHNAFRLALREFKLAARTNKGRFWRYLETVRTSTGAAGFAASEQHYPSDTDLTGAELRRFR